MLVHDDLLATGGTARGAVRAGREAGAGSSGCAFVIELAFLHGRERLGGRDVRSLVCYDSE